MRVAHIKVKLYQSMLYRQIINISIFKIVMSFRILIMFRKNIHLNNSYHWKHTNN